jgi:hypothetical protein
MSSTTPSPERPQRRWRKRLARAGIIIACLIALVVTMVFIFPDEIRQYALKLVQQHFDRTIERYVTNLPEVDEVRILRIGPMGTSPSFGTYAVPLNDDGATKMNIEAEKILKGADAIKFATLWRHQDFLPDRFYMCHVPHHAIQFRCNGSDVVDVAVCFGCGNISFSGLVPVIINFEDDSPHYATLRSTMEQHVGAHEEKGSPRKEPAR